jgi:hypothetical protein
MSFDKLRTNGKDGSGRTVTPKDRSVWILWEAEWAL